MTGEATTAGKLLKWGLLIAASVTIFPYWHAWVLQKLWTWHAVPLGAPPVSVTQAFALTVLVAALAPVSGTVPAEKTETPDETFRRLCFQPLARPAFFLFLGQLARTVLA